MTDSSPLRIAEERTQKGSRARQIVRLVWWLTEDNGRGVEIQEIRQAYDEFVGTSPPRSLTSEVHSLKKRGVLEAVGGRASRMLFALPGSLVSGDSEADEALAVLRALRRAWRRLKRPLSTREVADELRALGRDIPHPNGVRKRLEMLASSRTRGPGRRRKPLVRKVSSTAVTGAAVSFWLPANAQWDGTLAPRSRAEWVRAAVRQAGQEAAAPLDRFDLRWWVDHLDESSTMKGIVMEKELGRVFRDTLAKDTAHVGEDGRLHGITTPYTCYGGPSVRVTLGPPAAPDRAFCHVLDALRMLRAPDELEGIAELEARAQLLGSEVFREIAEVRRALLAWGISEAVGDTDRSEIRRRIEWKGGVLHRWLEQSGLTENQREVRRRQLDDWWRTLAAFDTISALEYPTQPPALRVGEAGLFNLYQLDEPIQATQRLVGEEEGDGRYLVEAARRFPPSDLKGSGRIGASGDVTLALVDRVDAVSELIEAVSVPRAAVLLEHAKLVLGESLRDPVLLLRHLRSHDALELVERQALVVALGWLGLPISFDEAVHDPGSYEEVSAWILATVLADWDGARERIGEVRKSVSGAAEGVVDTALMRLDMGGLFSVIG